MLFYRLIQQAGLAQSSTKTSEAGGHSPHNNANRLWESQVHTHIHGLPEKHIQRYLDEFCYRFNRRQREAELFDRLLLACVTAPAVTRDELTT